MSCQLHEVMLDHSHDVEAIGHDSCVWKIASNQAAIRAGEVNADDLDQFSAFEFFEE